MEKIETAINAAMVATYADVVTEQGKVRLREMLEEALYELEQIKTKEEI